MSTGVAVVGCKPINVGSRLCRDEHQGFVKLRTVIRRSVLPIAATLLSMREDHRSGLAYLEAVTSLHQRVRVAHPTSGLYEAAEFDWWWSIPRPTDAFPQLFWFDDDDQPTAAVITTDFGDGTSALYDSPTIVVCVLPDAEADLALVGHVVDRGLANARSNGIEAVELEVGQTDEVMRQVLFDRGFAVKGDGLVNCWMEADDRPEVSPLEDGYRLVSRVETAGRPHHMTDGQRRAQVEERLQQTSLYRPDLDLVVLDGDDNPAAYGMFWHDPVSATGVVEPMRTHDDHQQRGLARHLLTAGVDLLARAGAERISIGYEPDNPASGHLYRSVGFVPHGQSDLVAGPTG